MALLGETPWSHLSVQGNNQKSQGLLINILCLLVCSLPQSDSFHILVPCAPSVSALTSHHPAHRQAQAIAA
jgi:hypothetical protein